MLVGAIALIFSAYS